MGLQFICVGATELDGKYQTVPITSIDLVHSKIGIHDNLGFVC